MFDFVIMNGKIVDCDRIYKGNIYIKDEKIAAIDAGENNLSAHNSIDARDNYIFPGIIDAHAHIGEYDGAQETMETSTKAALAGGITTCIDMPINIKNPSIINKKLFEEKKKLMEQESYIDFCMWGGLVGNNEADLYPMHEAGAASFKAFLSPAGSDYTSPSYAKVRSAMKIVKEFGGMIGFHCEDSSIIEAGMWHMESHKLNTRQAFLDSRPLIAELLATDSVISLAKETGAKVHICHVSHPEVARHIETAMKDGIDISAETCPHYLTFSKVDLLEKGCLFKCAPPLRDSNAREELWNYVNKGVLSCVGSDHSPGMPEERDDRIKPVYQVGNGISGIQTMLQVYFDQAVHKRGFSPTLLAKTLADAPAKRWGIYGKKGGIKVGFDADLVIVDPNKHWEITKDSLYYKQQISCYVGLKGKGMPVATILRGHLACKDNVPCIDKGIGRFTQKQ